MTADNFRIYLQNRLIQAGQTGGQLYNDTSPLSVHWQWPQIKAGRLADKVDRLVNRCAHLAANAFMAVTNMTNIHNKKGSMRH
jgi:hypothetical protein